MAYLCAQPFVWMGKLICPEDRPSPIYVIFTCVINIVPLIMHAIQLTTKEIACNNPMRSWLIAGMITEAINILFAFYVYMRFSQQLHETQGGAWKTAWKLFLYDIGVCMYMLFGIWMIVWISFARSFSSSESVCTNLGDQLTIGSTCLILYMILGIFVICFSLVTECCKEPRWRKNQQMRAQGACPPPPMGGPSPQPVGGMTYASAAPPPPPPGAGY
eukprot:PhF_6_TR25605/c1_g2_i2/m.35926